MLRNRYFFVLGHTLQKHALLVTLFVFIAATTSFAAATRQKVQLTLQWYPQAQFAGYYMAREKGMYAAHGLDVEIIPGNADRHACEKLGQGKTAFCTAFLSDALQLRLQDLPLVNVGQIVQRSALMLIARKDSNITTLQDLDGAKIGTWGDDFSLQPKALFKRQNLNVTLVRQSPSFELFMRGGLDAVLAMWYNEYHRLLSYGLNQDEMTIFFFSDLGLNLPEDGIYCLESTYTKSPETSNALVTASAKGWLYAFAHPEETIDTMLRIMKESNVRANRAHQSWMLERMKDLLVPEGQTQIDTILKQADFSRTQQALQFTENVQSKIAFPDFYKGRLQ